MLCFLDRAFCSSDCTNRACYRNFSPELQERARIWWDHDTEEPPVALMDFTKDCDGYQAPEENS